MACPVPGGALKACLELTAETTKVREMENTARGAPIGRFLAALGATLLALVFAATSVVAILWATVTLLGLPQFFLWGLAALGVIPVIWAGAWTAGRAWHVERLLEKGGDIDQPAFTLRAYFGKKQSEPT
jgi:hypothetical protein